MRSISMAYPTIDLAATGAHIRQLWSKGTPFKTYRPI